MELLWAPWRMEFIKGERPKGCIFCDFPSQSGEEADRKNLVLGRSERSFVMLNKFPYNSGHLMVIPRRHTADFTSLSREESEDLHRLLQGAVKVVADCYRPDGLNLGMNLGAAAGAGIVDHLHYHLVPRWGGDTNFLPVLAETKVIVEHVQAAYDRLRPPFDRELGG
ncbi:MAG: HIT domain-containing protein [Myxococcales bacterium]|nr:HIT domain-containing protein [Myxococcales bacterium]